MKSYVKGILYSAVLFYAFAGCKSSSKENNHKEKTKVTLQRMPYLQSALADSISILWRTNLGSECLVKYQLKQGGGWQQQAGVILSKNDLVQENIVTIKGLERGQVYAYSIYTDGMQLASNKDLQFRTALASTDSVFTFFAAGDIGESVEDGGTPDKLAKTMWERNSAYDLGLLLGDIIYPIGESAGYDIHLFPYFKDVFSRTTVWPIPGNHDWGSDIETNYAEQWKLPGNEHYYSFDQGNVHFIGLDSKKGEFYEYEKQKSWLEDDLKKAQQNYDWIVVFLHHNGKSCTYKDDYDAVVSLYPLFDQYNVDLVLNGHAHTYERLKPMNGKGKVANQQKNHDLYQDTEGFISITAGSGGKLRGVGSDPTAYTPDPSNCKYLDLVAFYNHTWAYLEIAVNGKILDAKTISVQNGEVLDSFVIKKSK
ncbi:metallophosphoesterase [Reichenbachiella sp. MALMAid0571]|uniref:metallophosphoesterase n=1 Tax=Reichenbachiella sp. MALMAid0571 TaxID=3143939 RepID=UPI0032DF563E